MASIVDRGIGKILCFVNISDLFLSDFQLKIKRAYACVTIAAVYVLGNPICMSRKQLSSLAVETVVQIGIFALARREERIRGNEEACTGKCFLALHFIDQYLMCSGPRRKQPLRSIDV